MGGERSFRHMPKRCRRSFLALPQHSKILRTGIFCSAAAKLPLLARASWLAGSGCPFAAISPLGVKAVASVVPPSATAQKQLDCGYSSPIVPPTKNSEEPLMRRLFTYYQHVTNRFQHECAISCAKFLEALRGVDSPVIAGQKKFRGGDGKS